ncbi:MAG: phenylalanine--tRNA ligase subunit beta, partial [Polyangiales bacterium]
MRISVAWVRALLPALEGTAHEARFAQVGFGAGIAKALTGGGLEVEAIHRFGEGCDKVVVARVQGIRPHPSKSGLQLVTVDRGGASQEVVCGAKNVPAPGGLVVLAPVGAHLPAVGITIAPRAIGGVTSEGMLCSEEELGLAFAGKGDGEGILILPEGIAEPGTPLTHAVHTASDEILEIGVTPNRPDALGHIGVARELAALLNLPFELPRPEAPEATRDVATDALVKISVDPAARERCPHYGALGVLDVSIAPSPLWVRYRLHALGVRSISNAVDVTNLVMLEYGHPLHAFDLDRLEGQAIHVRLAREGELVVTLDGVERKLFADDLVICDGAPNGGKPVAIAGVMGAGNSEISSSTKRILLECAWFDPRSVRRTARRHGLHTESSHRFERGVDRGGVESVLEQAGSLTSHLTKGGVAKSPLHVVARPAERASITLRHARLESLLGMAIDREEAVGILSRLGCSIASRDAETTVFLAPTHRPDLGREVDLIEEIARVRGFDAIPTQLPAIRPQPPRTTGLLERRVRHAAAALGLSEAVSYGFGSPRELEIVGAPAPVVTLQNPLGEERGVMRT